MSSFADEYTRAVVKFARLHPEPLEAFHAGMRETPDADLPHLVFADYLEDNGHPEIAHLIRRAAEEGTREVRNWRATRHPLSITASPRLHSVTDRSNWNENTPVTLHVIHATSEPHYGVGPGMFVHSVTMPAKEAFPLVAKVGSSLNDPDASWDDQPNRAYDTLSSDHPRLFRQLTGE